ncbi:MAG: DUF3313 family protein [Pseudomonadales bacterium]|jgi:hypothetical protein|nr:DUF3313 family protein [Pseudomonadales bacterium]
MNRTLGIILFALSTTTSAAGFLEPMELEKLTPHPDVEGVYRYLTPGAAAASSYDKVIMGSVSFFFSEDSKVKSIEADEMKAISDALKSAFVMAASEYRSVVLSPGEGTALVNLAITDINMQNKKRGLLGYTPIGLVVSTAGNLAGLRVELREAHIEGELVDSVSGEVISIFRVEEITDIDGKKKMSWDDLVGTLQASLTQAMASWQ